MADQLLGILGGTFDPPHIGHLRTVLDVQQSLNLSEIRIIPNYIPAHREQPVLEAQQRYQLLQKALQNVPGLIADDREIKRQGISYMVDTLRDPQQQFPQKHLCLIIGTDAYNSFCQWHEWQEIIQLSHLVVMQRAGVAAMVNKELDQLLTTDADDLIKTKAGRVYAQNVSQLDVSSTVLRQMIQQQQSIQFLVPENIRSDLQTLYKG
ncbi:MAG: nicotinate-nucleotide adenylyltransferase [Gammaproteobacteria bacterium]|nr:nicotinate-nucleotide adenylyltransferase [Gammaproteobacteria bacterium]